MNIKNLFLICISLFLVSMVLCGCSEQREKLQAAKPAIEMEQWAKDLLAAWTSHDVENTLAFYADDCIFEDFALGRFLRGKEEIRAHIKEGFTGFPDLKIEMKSFFASGNHACIEFVMSGTQTGNLPALPATGKHFSIPGVAVIELKEGKAIRESDYYDGASFIQQLGGLPAAMASDPITGTWKLDANRTEVRGPAGDLSKSSTVKIETQENGITLKWDAVKGDGKAIHGVFSAKYDGRDYPVAGDPTADTVSLKQIDANTVNFLFKKRGKDVFSERAVVSKDGKTISLTVKGTGIKGEAYEAILFYDRQ